VLVPQKPYSENNMIQHESQSIAEEERTPSLRIAVTGACNLKCFYCPIDGDNYLLKGKRFLDAEDFSHVATKAYESGIRHFSITGGEPLATPNLTFPLARIIRDFRNLGYLRLNTNGLALKDYADSIEESGFHKVKVSIDSLKIGKYQGTYKRDAQNVKEILEGIDVIREKRIPVRINMVVGKYNEDEVLEMVDFCETKGLELKLFDITFYRDSLATNHKFWENNYVSLVPLVKEFSERFGSPKIVYAVGGFGNPMPVFRAESDSPIRLRISESSAMYDESCAGCQDFLCQDGFCNLTLTTDGDIKPCRPEGLDFGLRLVDHHGKLLPDEQIRKKFAKAIKLFQGVKEKQRTLDDITESWSR